MSDAPTQTQQRLQPQNMRLLAIAAILGIALGWLAATSPVSPIKPKPEPSRPVLSLLARLAKLGLWVMWVADPPPNQSQHLVHARADEHGQKILNHGDGW